MRNRLSLPPLQGIKHLDGKGNFAVKKYYAFPFSFFYQKKLRMILNLLDRKRIYRNILDFGSGEAEIFKPELSKRALNVKCVDKVSEINVRWKFDVVVCSSVLEFCNLNPVLNRIRQICQPYGMLVGASVMDTWATRLYFKLIGDKQKRKSHKEILEAVHKHFFIVEQYEWFGLYLSFKGYPK